MRSRKITRERERESAMDRGPRAREKKRRDGCRVRKKCEVAKEHKRERERERDGQRSTREKEKA